MDSEGDLNVTTAAALHGTSGLAALVDNTTAMYLRDDTPNAEPRYRARFYFDPNALTMAEGDQFVLLRGRSTTAEVFRVKSRRNAGSYQVNLSIYDDAAGTTGSAWETISDASHYLEIDWQAATGAGANNGSLALYIDGTLERTLSGIDNDTLRVDEVRLGPSSGLDSGTSGTFYLDGFESRRSTYIGPLAGLPGGRSHLAALPHEAGRNPGFFARLTTRMYRALAAAFIPGLPIQPAASVLRAPPAGQTWKTYYYAGGLVAMRELTASGGNTLYYLHADHLGSTSLTTCGTATTEGGCDGIALGGEVARQLYLPYGGIRYATGTMPTDIGYTGQRLDDTGLMHYGARYYSPYLNRWIQPDTIVPDPANPQSLNRFSYALNNPLRYIDPTGHEGCDVNNIGACQETELIELILKGTPGWVNGFITHWLSLLRQSPTGLALINSLKEAGISWQVMFGDVAREGDAATIEQIGDGNGKDWRVIIDSEIFIRGLGAVLGSQTAPEVFLKSLTN